MTPETFNHLGQNLAVTMRAIKDLVPHRTNPRTHSELQLRQIARSIAEFGFTNPILVDGDGGILAGHGRIEGAKLLGIVQVPVIELCHLSEAQRRAYIIADNRLAEKAGWDQGLLAQELEYLTIENAIMLLRPPVGLGTR
jgi:ParB-like chromosome segregation protein Spo0J